MGAALFNLGTKDMDTVLAWIMFAGVALAAATVFVLYGRHHHRKRRARKAAGHGKNHGKPS
jgi:hypothetical protein